MIKILFSRLSSYVAGSTMLLFSEGLYDLAFAIYAYQISGKASVGAITYALGYSSEILVSFIGGGILDRFGKFRIYTITILTKVVMFAILVYWGHTRGIDEIAIWTFAFLIDAIHHFSKLNNVMAVADLFKGQDNVKAHGFLAAIQGLSRILGPLLGAVLIAKVGAINSLAFCAVFQISALIFYYISFWGVPTAAPKKTSVAESTMGTWRALKEVARSPAWRSYFALDAFTTLLAGTSILLMVPLIKQIHKVPDEQLGVFFAAGAVGAIVGGLLLSRLHQKLPFGRWMALMILIQALGLLMILHSPIFMVAIGAKLLLDFAMTSYFRSSAVFLQGNAPEEQRGTYYCGADAVSRTLGLIGVVSAGFLFDNMGPMVVYSCLAALMLVVAVGWWNYSFQAKLQKQSSLETP